jgi:hypothetical protein
VQRTSVRGSGTEVTISSLSSCGRNATVSCVAEAPRRGNKSRRLAVLYDGSRDYRGALSEAFDGYDGADAAHGKKSSAKEKIAAASRSKKPPPNAACPDVFASRRSSGEGDLCRVAQPFGIGVAISA